MKEIIDKLFSVREDKTLLYVVFSITSLKILYVLVKYIHFNSTGWIFAFGKIPDMYSYGWFLSVAYLIKHYFYLKVSRITQKKKVKK